MGIVLAALVEIPFEAAVDWNHRTLFTALDMPRRSVHGPVVRLLALEAVHEGLPEQTELIVDAVPNMARAAFASSRLVWSTLAKATAFTPSGPPVACRYSKPVWTSMPWSLLLPGPSVLLVPFGSKPGFCVW